MKKAGALLPLILLMVLAASFGAFAQSSAQVSPEFLKNARPLHSAVEHRNNSNLNFSPLNSSGVPGIDSIVNFVQSFHAPGVDPNGNPQNLWFYSMVGNPPQDGGLTLIQAPVIPVSLNLLNPDGSVLYHYDVTPFVLPTLLSPVFVPARFPGEDFPTQFTDAVARAEFQHSMANSWHTILISQLQPGVALSIPAGKYVFALNPDNGCCAFVLVDEPTFEGLLFPATFPVDNSTPIGAAENSGVMTTKEITTFLFPNTYLYQNGDPKQCCVVGFHTFDFEPGIPANGNLPRAYMMVYASWISPGIFVGGAQDVTGLSHEMAETFNDPFVGFDGVHNVTPWWESGGQCQDVLEVGDVIEGLPSNVVFPISAFGMTYHPQNVALLPWFEFDRHSDAFRSAYSYPNPKSLPDLSQMWNVGCAAPL